MIAVVRAARVVLLLGLALIVISLIMVVGTTDTGPVEKVVLLLIIGGLVFVAAKVTALSERLVHTSRRS